MSASQQYENDLVLRAARGETTPRPPVWLMRQAGRPDPAYLAYRERVGLPLEALFRHPEHAAHITLLPRRIGVDALIVFQDILTPLTPMGAPFVFAPGPKLEVPVRSAAAADRLHAFDVATALGFVGETFSLVHHALGGAMPVLGFAGAPFTLLVFLVEGGSFGDDIGATRRFLEAQPEAARRLLDRLTEVTIAYLRYQVAHGAAAVQLFESAAHVLAHDEYQQWALPYQQTVFAALRGTAPTIQFARAFPHAPLLKASGADILSLPDSLRISEARAALGADTIVQGNLDNRWLVTASPVQVAERARAIVDEGQHRGHIFNLSHGLLRETPFENVVALVQAVVHSA